MLFVKTFFSQTISNDDPKIEDIFVFKDTTINNYRLNFKLNVQYLDSLESLELTIVDQNSVAINNIGSYTIKFHQNGFYYLENSLFEKKSFLNNDAFFINILNSSMYNACWKIQLKTKSKLNIVKTKSYLIQK